MNYKMRLYPLFFLTFIFLALISCMAGSSEVVHGITSDTSARVRKDSTIKDTISIVAVGDMMLGSAYPNKSGLPPDDATGSFENVQEFLKGDIVFGNLEGCFLDNGKSTKCKDPNSNSCF